MRKRVKKRKLDFQQILPWIKNKYFITICLFFIWMLFFDRYDLVYQYKLNRQLNTLEDEKVFYLEKIEEMKITNEELFTDEASLEKFAREEYLMKKENEEIFLIVKE